MDRIRLSRGRRPPAAGITATATTPALALPGPQTTSMARAAVVDREASSTVRGRDTQRQAQERLDTVASEVSGTTTAPVATVILFGEPAHALQHDALENGDELIVAGSRLAVRTHTRSRLGGSSPKSVPVLIGPA